MLTEIDEIRIIGLINKVGQSKRETLAHAKVTNKS
jgi:hypothetical protein